MNQNTPADEEPGDFAADDPVDILLTFAKYIEGQRMKKSPVPINDRERWFVTLILSVLADPNHHVGKLIMRNLIKVWIERGGIIPKRGPLAKFMRETDQFEFAVQYLYDYGMTMTEIGRVMGVNYMTVGRHLRFIKEVDRKLISESDEIPHEET